MTLFDLPEPEPVQRLSADRRRTLVNQGLLDRGIHPATLAPVAFSDERCGTCAHHIAHRNHRGNGWWHKCELHRLGKSASAASDIRISWPACTRWEPES